MSGSEGERGRGGERKRSEGEDNARFHLVYREKARKQERKTRMPTTATTHPTIAEEGFAWWERIREVGRGEREREEGVPPRGVVAGGKSPPPSP